MVTEFDSRFLSGSPDSWLTTTTKNHELLVALKNLCIVSRFTFFVLFVQRFNDAEFRVNAVSVDY